MSDDQEPLSLSYAAGRVTSVLAARRATRPNGRPSGRSSRRLPPHSSTTLERPRRPHLSCLAVLSSGRRTATYRPRSSRRHPLRHRRGVASEVIAHSRTVAISRHGLALPSGSCSLLEMASDEGVRLCAWGAYAYALSACPRESCTGGRTAARPSYRRSTGMQQGCVPLTIESLIELVS